MKIVAIIQARMGSTRLPGKVLLDLAGEPMLGRVVNRTQRATTLREVVVATTVEPDDESIVQLCAARDWPCFRGSEEDVLDRYYLAAKEYRANVVVRITSDCPLIEPEIVDLVVQEFCEKGALDYVSNTLPPRNFPRGLDVEVMSFEALERAWHEDKNPVWREHVTPYIYRNPEKFTLRAVVNNEDYSHMRWTVDTPEDLAFVRRVYDNFGHNHFSWHEVLVLLEGHSEWLKINQNVVQKKVH
jgi:spore coat polysaccharide biosynthesis protein SpsF